MLDKSGYEVTSNVFTSTEQVKLHQQTVLQQNMEILKANRAIEAELKDLKKQIEAKTREMVKCDDPLTKGGLQQEIDGLKAKLAAKQAEFRPYIVVIGPQRFDKREQADAYVERVRIEAERARSKAKALKEKNTG